MDRGRCVARLLRTRPLVRTALLSTPGNREENMKITIVVDNRSPSPEWLSEHGFCAYIETDNAAVLFDSGKGAALFPNLRILGLDVALCATVVLSHGHHDHAGGLPELLTKYPAMQLDATAASFLPKWSLDPDGSWRYAGISEFQHALPPQRRVIHDAPRQILPGIWSTGPLWPRGFAPGAVHDKRLHVNLGDKCIPDPFCDEQALVLQGPTGLAVLVGCCHRGIAALLAAVERLFPGQKVELLAGGLHMAGLGAGVWDEALEAVRHSGVQKLVSLHCSGDDWMDYAEARLPGIAQRGHVGTVLEWELA